MAAASLANLEKLFQFACRVQERKNDAVLDVPWETISWSLRNLIDDRAALAAVCVAVSALEDEANSKALTDAGTVASALLIGA